MTRLSPYQRTPSARLSRFSLRTIFLRTFYLYSVALFFLLAHPSPAHTWPGAVVRVVDGDTVVVAPLGATGADVSVRFYGIDAPELDQPGGVAARDMLMNIIKPGDAVDVVSINADRYHRPTALVLHEGRFLNIAMLQQGHAWVYRQYCRAAFCPQWITVEVTARQDKRGLWDDAAATPPWQWRRNLKNQDAEKQPEK